MQRVHPSSVVLTAIAAMSAGALGLALIAQWGYDLWPCLLCYWQRPAYGFTLALALLGLMPAVDAASRRAIVLLCAVLFIANNGIAVYHVGVEERWWEGPSECVGQIAEITLEDIAAALNKPGRTGCTEAAFRLWGISMAGYNVIACALLALGCLWASRKPWWTDKP
ncbi:MAG: disulfide bond formation protein B [Rhodospirillaceae bacterium]|nr:disulfide bond formation protein B [Rhodospirillaceae bacterium]